MLKAQHALVGGIIGLIFGIWAYFQGNPLFAVGCFLIAIWGSILPDYIDPPTSYLHRSIGHNLVSFFVFIFMSIIGLALSIIFHSWIIMLPTAFAFGFLSHLILDLTTPMGLPLFVGKQILGIITIPAFFIPILNILLVIFTIITAFSNIKYLAKKIGGVWAMLLFFIPVWGAFLLLGVAFLSMNAQSFFMFLGSPFYYGKLFYLLGYILIILFVICVSILSFLGLKLDNKMNREIKIKSK